MAVIDTSVWLDLFLEDEERKKKAERLIGIVGDICFIDDVLTNQSRGVSLSSGLEYRM